MNDFYEFLGAHVEDATYRASPGWVKWYDTEESQRLLGFQSPSYQHYAEEMRDSIAELMAG